jgi:hypothetical protein
MTNNVDKIYISYTLVNIKNDMANILKTEKKVAVISMLAKGKHPRH